MLQIMHGAKGKFGLSAAALLVSVLVGTASAAVSATGQNLDQGVDLQRKSLQELDEIWVRGKRLNRSIADVEDDFFKLYNKLNMEDDYDIHCGYASIDRGSMIMSRVCAPEFLAYLARPTQVVSYYRPPVASTLCYTSFNDPSYYGFSGGAYSSSSCYSGGMAGGESYVVHAGATINSPPPGLVLMERGPEYTAHVIKVINSDARLLEKYTHLVGLYDEMRQAQSRYVKVKADAPPRGSPGPHGPR